MYERAPYMRAADDPPKIPSDIVVIYCPVCREPMDPYEDRGGIYSCPDCGTWFIVDVFGEKEQPDWSERMAKDNDIHAWRQDRLFQTANGLEPVRLADHTLTHIQDVCIMNENALKKKGKRK